MKTGDFKQVRVILSIDELITYTQLEQIDPKLRMWVRTKYRKGTTLQTLMHQAERQCTTDVAETNNMNQWRRENAPKETRPQLRNQTPATIAPKKNCWSPVRSTQGTQKRNTPSYLLGTRSTIMPYSFEAKISSALAFKSGKSGNISTGSAPVLILPGLNLPQFTLMTDCSNYTHGGIATPSGCLSRNTTENITRSRTKVFASSNPKNVTPLIYKKKEDWRSYTSF